MNQEQQINELYGVVFRLINELEDLKWNIFQTQAREYQAGAGKPDA